MNIVIQMGKIKIKFKRFILNKLGISDK